MNEACDPLIRPLRQRLTIFGLVLLLAAAGCGRKSAGSLRGKVTFANQPLAGGQITFFASEGESFPPKTFPILSDGTFQAFDLPAGTLYVAIDMRVAKKGSEPIVIVPPNARPGENGGLPQEAVVLQTGALAQGKEIPEKYADPRTSGLTIVIELGKEIEKDFELD